MKSNVLLLISLLAAANSFSAESGGTTGPKPGTTSPPPSTVPLPPAGSGPQAVGMFRIVKPDGIKVIQQGPLSVGSTSSLATITIGGADAFMSGGGKCAFNVKYDEVSSVAATNTTNRIFSNDTLIAQNTKIDLAPNVLKTIWTQPYLSPGVNYVKLVVNAESEKPSVAWIRINVTGSCGGVTAPAPKDMTPPKVTPPSTTKPGNDKPPVTPAAPAFGPGTSEWSALYTAWGYSNYATTQLKGKGYARYADLAKLNSDITAVINAKRVERSVCKSLMERWNSFLNDPAFKATLTGNAPSTGGK